MKEGAQLIPELNEKSCSKMFSVTFRLILKHLHYPSADQSLDAWNIPLMMNIGLQWFHTLHDGWEEGLFLGPFEICARRKFISQTDQTTVVLRKALGPHLAAVIVPHRMGLQPQCGLCAQGAWLHITAPLCLSGHRTWVRRLRYTQHRAYLRALRWLICKLQQWR